MDYAGPSRHRQGRRERIVSGGSLDYFCFKMGFTAEEIRQRTSDPLYLALADRLTDMEEALRLTEWGLSGDLAEEDAHDEIRRVLGIEEPSGSIPTATGPYWWRAKAEHKWTCVWITGFGYIKAHFARYDYHPDTWAKKHGIGQWLPCKPPLSSK